MENTGGGWVSDAVAEDDPFEPASFMRGRVEAERSRTELGWKPILTVVLSRIGEQRLRE